MAALQLTGRHPLPFRSAKGAFIVMDQSSERPGPVPSDGTRAARVPRAPGLAVVSDPLRLDKGGDPMRQSWSASLADLQGWLGIDSAFVRASDAVAPVFTPWAGWSPAAFQNGGCAGLPEAQFVASYCIDHARGGGSDVMLISPHPITCAAGPDDVEGEGERGRELGGLPRTDVLAAMIRAAAGEGRKRLAIIVHARHRAALVGLQLAEDTRLCPPGTALDILGIEDALPQLMRAQPAWDAVIALPDLRGIVFTLLAETTGVRGPWPMLWYGRGRAGQAAGRLLRVTCETDGKLGGGSGGTLPLDAQALVLALALSLRVTGLETGLETGELRAAGRLQTGWARLRDRGVTTARRGSDAPYACEVPEAEFIALLCRDAAVSQRPHHPERPLENSQKSVYANQTPVLRLVSSNRADL